MPQILLHDSNIRATVDERVSARMAQHVDVDWEADASTRPGLLHDLLCGCWCHWCPTLAHEQELTPLRLLTLEFTQHTQLPAGQRMYTANTVFGTRYGHPGD